MKKIILFDADGVVIKKTGGYFSDTFVREHGAPAELVTSFFKTRFRACQIGQADLKTELEPVLPTWGWNTGVDAFLDYWFATDVHVDVEVLKIVSDCRAQGAKVYLATDNEKYRGTHIWEKLKAHFDGHFFSYELGHTKGESEFFEKVLQQLNVPATDVTYFDDDQKNIDIAGPIGFVSHFFTSVEDLKP